MFLNRTFSIQTDLDGNAFNIPAYCQSDLVNDLTTGLGVPNFA